MAELRERISDAARELYLAEGLEGVSMRRIADKVGVSAPAIYRHFGSKDELLKEIVVRGVRILEGYLRPALDLATPRERILGLTDGYLRFALDEPRYFDFAFLAPQRAGTFETDLTRPDMATFRLAIDQVRDAMREGVLAPGDPTECGIAMWATVHGLITLFRTGQLGRDAGAFRALYRRVVGRMLGEPPG